jgi:hypothetical protein
MLWQTCVLKNNLDFFEYWILHSQFSTCFCLSLSVGARFLRLQRYYSAIRNSLYFYQLAALSQQFRVYIELLRINTLWGFKNKFFVLICTRNALTGIVEISYPLFFATHLCFLGLHCDEILALKVVKLIQITYFFLKKVTHFFTG